MHNNNNNINTNHNKNNTKIMLIVIMVRISMILIIIIMIIIIIIIVCPLRRHPRLIRSPHNLKDVLCFKASARAFAPSAPILLYSTWISCNDLLYIKASAKAFAPSSPISLPNRPIALAWNKLGNKIGADGAKALAEAMKHNTSLQTTL